VTPQGLNPTPFIVLEDANATFSCFRLLAVI